MERTAHYVFAEIEDRHALQQGCLTEGICVHGCGPLTVDDSKNRHCPVCGFKHFAHPTHEQPRTEN